MERVNRDAGNEVVRVAFQNRETRSLMRNKFNEPLSRNYNRFQRNLRPLVVVAKFSQARELSSTSLVRLLVVFRASTRRFYYSRVTSIQSLMEGRKVKFVRLLPMWQHEYGKFVERMLLFTAASAEECRQWSKE